MIILGSTGSIGRNTVAVARKFGIKIEVLTANKNIDELNRQIEEFKPKFVVVGAKEFLKRVNHKRVFYGSDGIIEVLNLAKSKLVVNALVGFFGLKPTLEAIKIGKKVALANKESLVVAGSFVDTSHIFPIDSEHFGLWYLLNDKKPKKMIITASGGAFRDTPLKKLKRVTPTEALKHPNWSMGEKITIDSATMTNKLFELLEAKWLFGIKKLDAIIETKSIIHALIDFKDGSTTAHIANANMQLPIAYAIKGEVKKEILKPIDLVKVGKMEFREINSSRYPIWEIKDDILKNPHLGVVVNAANEVVVKKFLTNKLRFLDISKMTLKAYNKFYNIKISSIEDIFEIDREVREFLRVNLQL